MKAIWDVGKCLDEGMVEWFRQDVLAFLSSVVKYTRLFQI